MNIDWINGEVRNVCDFDNYKQNIIDTLKNDYGWSDSDIDTISDELEQVADTVIQNSSSLSNASELVARVGLESNTQLENSSDIQESIAEEKLKDAYISKYQIDNEVLEPTRGVFGSEEIFYKEPIVTGVVTNPVDLEDSHYSLKEDYPNSYGFRDINGNYYKVNLLKNSIDLTHSSGTRLKIDKEGNITLHCVGSLKQVIEKDYTLKVKGNLDILVSGNMANTVGGTRTSNIGGPDMVTSAVKHKTLAPSIEHN